MAAIVKARVDRTSGWVQLRFTYDMQTLERIKVPGARWNGEERCWYLPFNAWEVVKQRVKSEETFEHVRTAPLTRDHAEKLKSYQLEGASFLTGRVGALLSMEQRTGKTPTALAALEALLCSGQADVGLIVYPAGVKENWRKQILDWTGRTLIAFETTTPLTTGDVALLQAHPEFLIGCHWEVLHHHVVGLKALIGDRRFVWVGDEIHAVKNRKGGRYKALRALSDLPNCVGRWGLTGTPQRNYPRDLWGVLDAIQPGCVGTYWTYAGAKGNGYCAAVINEMGHWEDKGESNVEELKTRLAAFSYRVTRAQVAGHLPKAQRSVIMCQLSGELAKQYKALETALATTLKSALSDADPNANERDALKQMALCTSKGKIPTAIDRALVHAEGRGVKCVVFAHHHEVLHKLSEAVAWSYVADTDARDFEHKPECAFKAAAVGDEEGAFCYCGGRPPVFIAAGWLTPPERHKVLEEFKNYPGPAILLANTLSVSVGIDLSEADTEIFLELEWVPSDFAQVHDRIQDVHLGKRTTPPLYEYLLAKDTIDVDMGMALLSKIRSITRVVGADTGSGDMARTLRESGLVETSNLALENHDKATVQAAINGLRDKLLGLGGPTVLTDKQKLAAAFGDEWNDEIVEGDDDNS